MAKRYSNKRAKQMISDTYKAATGKTIFWSGIRLLSECQKLTRKYVAYKEPDMWVGCPNQGKPYTLVQGGEFNKEVDIITSLPQTAEGLEAGTIDANGIYGY